MSDIHLPQLDDEEDEEAELGENDLLEDDDRSPSKPSRRPSVRPARGEEALENANSRAMFWVSFIAGSAGVIFVGLFCWAMWAARTSVAV